MQQHSIFIEDHGHQLHLRNIHKNEGGVPILMLHGTIENGKIFYTETGKGLACFLAEQGFDVYVADFRGKGESTPAIIDDPAHGQHEMIVHDVPAFIHYITKRTQQKMHVICHSWGGVVFNSSLVRFPKLVQYVGKQVCFGSKRSIHRKSFQRFWKVDVLWNRIAPLLSKKKGYINAVNLKFGADNETHQFLNECISWVKPLPWRDPEDNFDYGGAANQVELPLTWHITGINDAVLGHVDDVKAFIAESSPHAKITLLSKQAGNKRDYDHIDILTAKSAVNDHFPDVISWLNT